MPQAKQPFKTKLKKGDEVVIIAGKSKGKSGKILSVITATGRVIVEGTNLVNKFLTQAKAARLQREPGMIQKEASIAISNVMLKDSKTGKGTRVGYKVEADGSKVRVAKASKQTLDTVKKAKDGAAKPAKAPKAKSKN